jgi:hypothetical protein
MSKNATQSEQLRDYLERRSARRTGANLALASASIGQRKDNEEVLRRIMQEEIIFGTPVIRNA